MDFFNNMFFFLYIRFHHNYATIKMIPRPIFPCPLNQKTIDRATKV